MLFDAPSRLCTDVATTIAKWLSRQWTTIIAPHALAAITVACMYLWLADKPAHEKSATNGARKEDERTRELELEERRLAFEERQLALEERRLAFDGKMRTRERALEERRQALDER
ncbi:hypothetical protein KFE25_012637 [Diacronema lutheri]|uniref:Uncharacterized protein n=1 Tax=Diacronema lutheri TaxID=2081491 RepID=A0A8J5X4A8_DIALT|nr:hypothetical protein KFE25_012637 [Diacronema lutheri]